MLLDHGEPTNYEQAMMSPISEKWLEAMKSEIGFDPPFCDVLYPRRYFPQRVRDDVVQLRYIDSSVMRPRLSN